MTIPAARRALDRALLRIDAAFARLADRRLLAPLGVVALAALVMFVDLGGAEICESNEAVEALGVREMVEHGRWIMPLLNGQEPMFKPPLFHWFATAISHLLGASQVSEWTVRAPAAIFAVATVALCIGFVTLQLGRARGLLAGLILVGAYPFLDQGRYGRVDMVLAFFEALSLFSFVWWSQARRGKWLWHHLLALALALAVLAKGPVGALLPAGSIVLLLLWEGQPRELRALAAPGPIAMFLVVASSWYLACLLSRDWPALSRQLGSENFGRFFGTLGRMPLTYYVWPFLLSSIPFSLLAPYVVVRAMRQRPRVPRSDDAGAAARWPALLAIFAALTFVFFSIAAYKRRAYLLPIWPALSALVPWWIDTIADAEARRKLAGALAVAAVVLVAINGIYVPYKERRDCPAGVLQAVAAQVNRVVPAGQPIYVQGVDVDDASPLLFYLDRASPIVSPRGVASPAIVFAESWAGSPGEWRVLASSGRGWKRLLVVETPATLQLGGTVGAIQTKSE